MATSPIGLRRGGRRGDYAGAKKMLDELGVLRPEMAAALARLKDIPTDIEPIFVTADKLSPR